MISLLPWPLNLARQRAGRNYIGSYYSYEREIQSFDPWSVLGAVRCPMLVLAGEDDPICPLPVVEELASQLPKETTRCRRP